ncbi:hypothetical protein ARMSODRAFT_671652 [Armillaria solidipes]|uniref:Uncharacterized protein n=1 Tax=Armillaria solidipes TaxID=1076256 RepID=A0A2H3B284_9AGAR|nr:hypothetical protein ARMSODRAFT_671652 [Armillaria solidipes]
MGRRLRYGISSALSHCISFSHPASSHEVLAPRLAYMTSHPDICRLFILNGPFPFLETICKCWMFLSRTCEHQVYPAFRELIAGLLSVAHDDPSLSPIRTILTRERCGHGA